MLRGDSVPSFKHDRVTPAQIIILGFLLLIFTGAVLLMLPFSTQEPGGASFGDALFTATSATCVTGLVLHDTALYWSPFGQLVILLLIQVGGMGVVTIAVAIFMFAGKRIGLKQRWVMQESISACGSARNLVLEEDFGTRCFTQCPRSAMRALILWE